MPEAKAVKGQIQRFLCQKVRPRLSLLELTRTRTVFLPLSSGRVNNDIVIAPGPTPAHRRDPKSLSPCHQENGNVLFRFLYLMCRWSPNSAVEPLVKFRQESWPGSPGGLATLAGVRLRDQLAPAHCRELLPTHTTVSAFRRGC